MSRVSRSATAVVAAASAVLLGGSSVAQAAFTFANSFANPSQVNLAMNRLNTWTSNGAGGNGPLAPAYGSYGWDERWGSAPGQNINHFLSVHFPDPTTFSQIDISFYQTTVARAEDYLFEYSQDGSNWTTIQTFTGNASFDPAAYNLPTPVTANYLRYRATKAPADQWTYGDILLKMQVRGPAIPALTFANGYGNSVLNAWNGGTIQASSNINNPSEMLDGDTYFQWGQIGSFDTSTGASATVLMNDVYPIGSVGISSTGDNQRPKTIEVFGSPDAAGTNWTLIGTMNNIPNGFSTFALDPQFVGFQARRLRYDVKDTFNNGAGQNVYIEELFAYLVPEPTMLGAFALGGTVLLRRRSR